MGTWRSPTGTWRIWLLLAGRGFGKTLAGSNWTHELVQSGKYGRLPWSHRPPPTLETFMIEGASGILETAPNWNRPTYEPSKRRLTWPNGAIATSFSAEEAERLRGPNHDAAWCDELCAWDNAQSTWDMLQFTMRAGRDPRICITTTPKPTPLRKFLVAQQGKASSSRAAARSITRPICRMFPEPFGALSKLMPRGFLPKARHFG